MNRTIIALLALLPAAQAMAAPPSQQTRAPANAAMEERLADTEANARQRELDIRLQVLEQQNQKVQAEFAAMMEELDQGKDKSTAPTPVEAPKPAR